MVIAPLLFVVSSCLERMQCKFYCLFVVHVQVLNENSPVKLNDCNRRALIANYLYRFIRYQVFYLYHYLLPIQGLLHSPHFLQTMAEKE